MMIEIKNDNAMKALVTHKRCLHELDKALRLVNQVSAEQESLGEIDKTYSLTPEEAGLIKKAQDSLIKLENEIMINIGTIIKSATEITEEG